VFCFDTFSFTAAGQYELDYLPHRLGNWQVWDSEKLQHSISAKAAQIQQRPAKGFLVDDRGHMLPGETITTCDSCSRPSHMLLTHLSTQHRPKVARHQVAELAGHLLLLLCRCEEGEEILPHQAVSH
jgi:hypothetical protein